MENKESNIVHINFSQYKPPMFKEAKAGSLVLYGKSANDLYPDYLIDLYNESTNHKAVIDAKIRYTTGGGWTVDTIGMDIATRAIYEDKMRKINEQGDSLTDLTNKISPDFQIFNAFAIEVVYNKSRSKWVSLNYIPISRIRAYKTESGEIKYIHLTDWKGVNSYDKAKEIGKDRDFREWSAFGSNEKPDASELFYYRTFRPIKSGEVDVYAVPSYSAAIPWIELDKRTGYFHLNNIKNNFTAGTIINMFNGDPTPEQKEEIERGLKEKFAGDNADDTGGIMLVFNKQGSDAPTVTRLQAGDMDKMYLQVAEFARQGILTIHNMHSVLAGIATAGALGQRNEIETAYELFYSTYIVPVKEQVFERSINHLMRYNGLEPKYKLRDVKPLNFIFSESTITQYTPRDVMSSLIEKQLGVDFSDIQQKLSFSKAEKNPFDGLGEVFSDEDILGEYGVTLNADGYPEESEMQFKSMHMAKILDIKLTGLDAEILAAIKSNPKISVKELAEALKQTEAVITEKLNRLIEVKALTGELGNLKISKIADNTLKEEDVTLEIAVRYKYDGPFDSKNRTWCRDMMLKTNTGVLYKREEIDGISKSPDAPSGSPWLYRGGFYHNPKTGVTTPYCRHSWKAVTVKIKG